MPAKTADQWFSEYGDSHHNRLNKALHWICVPTIAACVIAFLWELPTLAFMHPVPFLNWGTIVVTASLLFYVRLSPTLALGMLLFSTAVIAAIIAYERIGPKFESNTSYRIASNFRFKASRSELAFSFAA